MRCVVAILLASLALRLDAAVAVVNEKFPVGDLTTARVRDMLLGRVTTWPSGNAVVIVLCTTDSGERGVMEVCARSASLLQRGWKRLVFSGTGAMPLVADTAQAAFEIVQRTPGAILVLAESPSMQGPVQVVPLDSMSKITR